MDPIDLIVIEPAHRQDLGSILGLLKANRLPPDGLESHLTTTLVARRAGALVGCAAIEIYEEAGLLRSVAVRSDLQGLGLGGQLVQSCLDMARRRGLPEVYLLTETAAEFFPKFGFVPVDREKVHSSVKQSLEFTVSCPEDAQALVIKFS